MDNNKKPDAEGINRETIKTIGGNIVGCTCENEDNYCIACLHKDCCEIIVDEKDLPF